MPRAVATIVIRTPLTLTVLLVLTGCGWIEDERREAAEAARVETLAEIRSQLDAATRRADRVAASADRILSPLPVMTPGERIGSGGSWARLT